MTKVYLNELSVKGSVNDSDIDQSINNLIGCIRFLHKHNVSRIIVDGNIGNYKVSADRTFYQLLGDEKIFDSDKLSIFVDSFQEIYRLRNELEEQNITSARCGDLDAVGLALASDYINNGVTLSLSKSGWDAAVYDICLEILNEEGEPEEHAAKTRNFSTTSTLEGYSELFSVEIAPKPATGKLLLLELKAHFPNLVFSKDAKKYIRYCHSNEEVSQIYERLSDLNNVAINLSGHPFKPTMFSSLASPESETRDRNKALNVLFEDGQKRHCGWHLRYTPGAGRIHFSSDKGDGKTIYVGYIGSKIGS